MPCTPDAMSIASEAGAAAREELPSDFKAAKMPG